MHDREVIRRFSDHQSELLDQIYQAATDSQHWSAFLESLVKACSSRSAQLLVIDRKTETVLCTTRVGSDDHSSYLHVADAVIYSDSRYKVQLLIQCTHEQGDLGPRLAKMINHRLCLHLRRALQLSRTAHRQHQLHSHVVAAAERSFLPFLLVDEMGYTPYQSPLAQSLIKRWPGLAITEGCVDLSHPAHRARFRIAVKLASDGTVVKQQPLVFTPEGSQTPIRILLVPLPPADTGDELWPDSKLVVVYLQDPALHLDVDGDFLAQLFGLTDAEARAAASVTLGEDPKDLAEYHQVSVHTVRTQLKSAMQKMRVHRQAELATRVILSAATRDRWLVKAD